MNNKKLIVVVICILLSIVINLLIGLVIVTMVEYEVEKDPTLFNINTSNTIYEIKDKMIPDIIENKTDEPIKAYSKFTDRMIEGLTFCK